MIYQNKCLTCEADGKQVLYIGETGLSGQERCRQHHDDIKNKPDKSHMKVHMDQDHPDLEPSEIRFKFKVIRGISSPFLRQISEAIAIRLGTMDGEQTLLNNKLEFSRCVLPELETVMKDRIVSRKIAEETREEIKQIELETCPEVIKMDKKRGKDDKHEDQPNKKRRRLDQKPKEKMKKIPNYFPAEDNRKTNVGQALEKIMAEVLDGKKVDKVSMSTISNADNHKTNVNDISQVLGLVEQADGTGQKEMENQHEALENVREAEANLVEEVQSQSSTSQHPVEIEKAMTNENEVDVFIELEQSEMDMKDGKKVEKVIKYDDNFANPKINDNVIVQVLGLVDQENGTGQNEIETWTDAEVKIKSPEGVQSQYSTSQHLGLEIKKPIENENKEKLEDGNDGNDPKPNSTYSMNQTNSTFIQEQNQAALDRTGPENVKEFPEADLEGEVKLQEAKNTKVQSQSQQASRYTDKGKFFSIFKPDQCSETKLFIILLFVDSLTAIGSWKNGLID